MIIYGYSLKMIGLNDEFVAAPMMLGCPFWSVADSIFTLKLGGEITGTEQV